MAKLTEKELTQIVAVLECEELVIRKCRRYRSLSREPVLKQFCDELIARHSSQKDEIIGFLEGCK